MIDLRDPVNRKHPLNKGRVAWWLTLPGRYGGKTWYDLIGLNHGTLTGMGNSTNGWRPSARQGGSGHMLFAGTGTSVAFPAAATGATFTIMAWQATAGDSNLLGHSSLNQQFRIGHGGSNVLSIFDGGVETISSTLAVARGQWSFVCVTQNATTISFYENGKLISTSAATSSITYNQIGAFQSGGVIPATGPIDDVSIYSRALSAAEVLSYYNLSRRGYPGILNQKAVTGFGTIPVATNPAGCVSSQFGGGRLGTGGTVAVTLCPTTVVVPPTCSCVDGSQPQCLIVSGLNITRDCNKFDTYMGEYTLDYLRTSLLLTHTASCTWSTGTLAPANNKNGVKFDIVFNASGPMGCGYYGTLTGDHGVAGLYFKYRGSFVVGNYDLYSSGCPGLPGRLRVDSVMCPVAHECTGGGLGTWPSSVQVDVIDNDYPVGDDRNVTGTYTATYSPPDDYFIFTQARSWGLFHIFVWCQPTVWAADLVDDSYANSPNPTYDRFNGGPHGGGPSPNSYAYVETRVAVGIDPVGATVCPLCVPAWPNAKVKVT